MRKGQPARERCYVCGAFTPQSRVLIDSATAAQIARVGRSTVERWARDGKVECGAPAAGGHLRIYLDSLFRDPPFREFDLLALDRI